LPYESNGLLFPYPAISQKEQCVIAYFHFKKNHQLSILFSSRQSEWIDRPIGFYQQFACFTPSVYWQTKNLFTGIVGLSKALGEKPHDNPSKEVIRLRQAWG